jgi:hypothetical protein
MKVFIMADQRSQYWASSDCKDGTTKPHVTRKEVNGGETSHKQSQVILRLIKDVDVNGGHTNSQVDLNIFTVYESVFSTLTRSYIQ